MYLIGHVQYSYCPLLEGVLQIKLDSQSESQKHIIFH
jgi:hypothetical protein